MLRPEFIEQLKTEEKAKKSNIAKAQRLLPVLRLKPKERKFADAILEGASPEEAMSAAGSQGNLHTRRSLAKGYLARPEVLEYLQWVDNSRPVNSRTCRNDAMMRLSRLLRNDEVSPMVHAVASRIALQHFENTQGWDAGGEGLPEGVEEAIVRIRRKIKGKPAPKPKQLEAIAEVIPDLPCDDNPFAIESDPGEP